MNSMKMRKEILLSLAIVFAICVFGGCSAQVANEISESTVEISDSSNYVESEPTSETAEITLQETTKETTELAAIITTTTKPEESSTAPIITEETTIQIITSIPKTEPLPTNVPTTTQPVQTNPPVQMPEPTLPPTEAPTQAILLDGELIRSLIIEKLQSSGEWDDSLETFSSGNSWHSGLETNERNAQAWYESRTGSGIIFTSLFVWVEENVVNYSFTYIF